MRILYLTTHLNVGGITSYVLSLARGMHARGHRVYVASSGGDCVSRFTQEGIVFVRIPIRTKSELNVFKIGISFFVLLGHIRQHQIQIVHSNTRVTQVLGALLERWAHVRHVATWHGFFKPRFFRRRFPCAGTRTIAISEPVREHLLRDFNVDARRVNMIYNGIDQERLRLREPVSQSEIKQKLGLRQGPVVGIIARLSDVKGHEFLVRAMAVLLEKLPGAQLLIIGEGPMHAQLARLVRELRIEPNVFFVARTHYVQEALYAMDVFVMPSLQEGLGLGLMEAMAWGKAVVASSVGGIVDLIRHRKNGLLVPARDVAALAQAIQELLEDAHLNSLLGMEARKTIAERFSFAAMLDQTERVYQECLNA